MLSASMEFRQKVARNTRLMIKAVVTFADGEIANFAGDDFMGGTASFTEATSSSSAFDIGAAVIGKFSCALNNFDRRFDGYDFTGARIEPYVGVELSDGGTEWVKKGIYHIEQPDTYGSTIGLDCYDNLSLLEKDYAYVQTSYPATLRTIVEDICQYTGLTLAKADFRNCGFVAKARPDGDETCLSVLSYAAQAAGCWVKADSLGRIALDWYDRDALLVLSEVNLDGGTFDVTGADGLYGDGDEADGGNFSNYAAAWSVDGGNFIVYSGLSEVGTIDAISSLSMCTDEVTVTGVKVVVEGDDDEADEALWGVEGYVLKVYDNPLISIGQAAEVAEQIGRSTVHMVFRPYTASVIGNPLSEAGDPVAIIDRNGTRFASFITNQTYKMGNYQSISCDAETPARNSSASYSATTKAYLKAHKEIEREKTKRELAIEELATRLAESGGLFATEDVQSDGSTIYYMHDKPTLEESSIVWKLTAEALAMSTDGGETYPYGLSVDGDSILNRIYAIGIDASYITTGALVVKEPDTAKTMFRADLSTGEVVISADSVTVGSGTLTAALNGYTRDMAVLEQTVNGLKSTVSSLSASYGTCATAASVANKVVVCEGFELTEGAAISVKFANANTASNPKLNVNGTGSIPIFVDGAAMTSSQWWKAGDIKTFIYADNAWNVDEDTSSGLIVDLTDRVNVLEQTADGLTSTVSAMKVAYGTCATAASTATKVVTAPGFTLYTGAEITVKFADKNTAANPRLNVNSTGAAYIYVNDTYMSDDYYWEANGVMTFRYDGSHWVAIDSATLSLIKQTADSIELSVTGSLGSTASIKLSVNGETQTKNIDMSNVRSAFANDKSAITISSGTVTFNSNTFVVNSTNFSVTATGVITAKSGTIGNLKLENGALNYNGRTSHTGSTYGVLLNTTGISTGNNAQWNAMANAAFYGGYSSGEESGYISFNTTYTPTNTAGTRVAGKGCLAILTPYFGIGAYYARGQAATFSVGITATKTFVTSLEFKNFSFTCVTSIANGTYYTKTFTIPYVSKVNRQNIHFTKGIMDTS